MSKDKILKTSKKIIQILMACQVALSIIFIIKNINYIPKYGDTQEFLMLSQTLQLPSYRTFIYPYFLNIAGKCANLIHINITYITYFMQNVINLFACAILVSTIKDIFKIKCSKKQFVLFVLFIFSIPFNIHFNMSIKCDSLSTSFTILFLCYLIKYMKTEKYKYAIYSLIMMFLSANTRSEKIYFLSFVLVATIVMEFAIYLYNKRKEKLNVKKIITILIILILCFVLNNIANGIFQNVEDSENTSESTILLYTYERIVNNTLPEIYEYLPDSVKQSISYEDAMATVTDGNTYKLPYLKLLEEDGNLSRVNQILKVAIRRNAPKIITNISGDLLKNMFSPYYIMFNTADAMYAYTVKQMEGEHYLFTDGYILYFNILFIFINIYGIANIKRERLKMDKEIMIMIFYTIVSAGFFSLLTGFNFHIRYVMPVYVMEIAIITILCLREKNAKKIKTGRKPLNEG